MELIIIIVLAVFTIGYLLVLRKKDNETVSKLKQEVFEYKQKVDALHNEESKKTLDEEKEEVEVPEPIQEKIETIAPKAEKEPIKEEIEEIIIEDNPEPIVRNNPDLPSLMVIEDNEEVALYLQALLEDDYDLYLASNGKQGIDRAFELIPDIIISDVMMPYKDGFEVCETLKNDHRTSHIPIILLTAKVDEEDRIKGLSRGADAYLPKPFNQKELFLRIKNLLSLKNKFQDRYKNLDQAEESAEEIIQYEDAFVKKLKATIEENLTNEKFNIARLCKLMGMSRSQLHLKIKALTDQSTSHFIRKVRLQKAKELLESGDFNITEVAFEVGFQSRSYFTTSFSEEFGFAPSKLIKD